MKRIFFASLIFVMLFAMPVKAENYTQEEIDLLNEERTKAALAEVERVKEAQAILAQNELDAANATAMAFAEDVQRRKEAYEDWVEDQIALAEDSLNKEEPEDENLVEEALAEETLVEETLVEETLEEENQIEEPFAEEMPVEEFATEPELIETAQPLQVAGMLPEDYDNLCKIVEAEAGNSGIKGKIMVANVVLNRVRHPGFENTITGVIMQKGQFSPARNGKMCKVCVSAETIDAVNRALSGENYAEDALYFKSVIRGNYFRGKKAFASEGGNNFYK